MRPYTYTTQRQLRAAFWSAFPSLSRKRGRGGDYLTDTRTHWCDFLEHLERSGEISERLAQRATLSEAR